MAGQLVYKRERLDSVSYDSFCKPLLPLELILHFEKTSSASAYSSHQPRVKAVLRWISIGG
jgi:hypothetical protein